MRVCTWQLFRAATSANDKDTANASELLRGLLDTLEGAKEVPVKLETLLTKIHKLSEIDTEHVHDKEEGEVAAAVFNEKLAVDTIFYHARVYVTKCHALAKYIFEEIKQIVWSVEECNIRRFKDFLKEILIKSQNCQKELQSLIKCIEEEEKQLKKELDIVKCNKKSAQTKAGLSWDLGIGGGILTGLGFAGAGGVFLFASLGPQALITIPVAAVVMGGASIFAAGGGAAITGATVGGIFLSRFMKKIKFYEQIADELNEMNTILISIEKDSQCVNEQLKLAIDNNLEDLQEEEKMNKLSAGKENVKRSILKTLDTLTQQADVIKEHCCPLMKATRLEEFLKN